MMAVDVELNETENRRVQLTDKRGDPVLLCAPDAADSDPVRAYIQAVTPTAPCGKSCFSLQPCGTGGEYCLFYLPGVDTLSVVLASRYTITVACTDDAEVHVSGVLTVTVISNTPPVFVPASPLSDGQIKTTQDLRMFCGDKATASITASDGYNSPIGPFTLGLSLNPYNAAPIATNLDTTVSYREKPGVGYTVLDLDVVDTTLFDSINIHMWANSSTGMELYELSDSYQYQGFPLPLPEPGTSLRTKLNPKYVREDLRSVTLYFILDDGYCSSSTYYLTVEVENFNERPRVYTTQPFLEAYEGEINIPNNIEIIDEEQKGGFTFALSSPNDLFDVNPSTGNIVTKSGLSVDLDEQNKIYEDFTVGVYAYDDQGRRSDEANVLVRVYDRNDNPPYFTQTTFNMAAQDCMEPGSIVGQVEGKDDDSEYNQNNFFYFGGGGSELVVMATGDVVLRRKCEDGEILRGIATIHDQGIFPGALDGDPATVVLPCVPTTTASPLVPSPDTIKRDVYACLILSAVLAATWLSLTVSLVLKVRCCHAHDVDIVRLPATQLFRSQRISTISRISHLTTTSTTISDHRPSPPSRRMSTGVAPDAQSQESYDEREVPVPPLLIKQRLYDALHLL
ncbi:cadherin EGF LAG seven-pass G-type receptor 2 [Elysia marginata]|uniref:Cadherin EGF LAG seven-pass G-type receptor 2 n=1 Tax=Elysia marginata TaxID=1093978 RepID=A0AAV4HB66_9GAST|nr:cadherin EGF LAG seven-pass G-type receptor 2 [Elysia marginata]